MLGACTCYVIADWWTAQLWFYQGHNKEAIINAVHITGENICSESESCSCETTTPIIIGVIIGIIGVIVGVVGGGYGLIITLKDQR